MRALIPLVIPSILMGLFDFSSFAVGLVVLAALYAPVAIISRSRVRFNKAYLGIGAMFFVYGGMAAALFGEIHQKQLYSFLALVFIVYFASLYIENILSRPFSYVRKTIYFAYFALLFIGIVGLSGLVRPGAYQNMNSPVFPFHEPSHFALVFSFVSSLMLCLQKGMARYLIVLVLFIFAVAFPNVTFLIASLLLAMLFVTKAQHLILISVFLTPGFIILSFSPDVHDYFSERIFSQGTDNLSRMVYEQGWESIGVSLEMTNGLGIGFQNLGKQMAGETTLAMEFLIEEALNRADGGFLLSKIVSEFGIAGAACCIFFCYNALKSGVTIVKYNMLSEIDESEFLRSIVPACSCYLFMIELFVRGVGYFSPTFIAMLCFSGLIVNLGTPKPETSKVRIK